MTARAPTTVTVGARVSRETVAQLDRVSRVLEMSGRSEALRVALEIGLAWLEGRARGVVAAREGDESAPACGHEGCRVGTACRRAAA